MLNIYLCEDDSKQRAYLTKLIKNIILIEDYDLNFCLATGNPHELLSQLRTNPGTSLYFLDIDLKTDMNGLVLAKAIREIDPRGFIVFVTTHSEMSFMTFSYKVEAMDFIIKDDPTTIDDRIHKCIIDAYEKYSSPNNKKQKVFKASSNAKDFCIPLDEIYYFETSENIHKVILHAHNRIVEFQAKLKDIEPLLDERFCRCHRSFIVNKEKISDIDIKERLLTLTNDETIFASRQGIKKCYNIYSKKI